MRRAKGITGRALALLLALAVSLMLLTAVTFDMGTAPVMMQKLMQRHAPARASGLPEADYPAMAEMITAYLRGTTDTFQYVYTVEDSECLAFHDYEQEHMSDVRHLFRLCQTASMVNAFVVPLLSVLGVMMMAPKSFQRWVQLGLLAVLAVVTTAVIWAAVDFESLFILFHKLAFTNDLWLLNPQTDMLIRLMPTEFFVSYAAAIGGMWFLLMLGALVFCELLRRYGSVLVRAIMSKRR